VQAISETIAQLPIHVHTRLENGGKERATDHPLYTLLHDAANEYTSAFCFKEAITRDALLQPHGGYAFINRIEAKPVELIPTRLTEAFGVLQRQPGLCVAGAWPAGQGAF
jgi:phage portal protein BeeE